MRLRRCDDERGTSLVEVVTTVGLLALVLATIYSGLFSASDAVSGTEERLRNLDEARTMMAVMTKDVRTAVRLSAGTSPFTTADGNTIVFFANLDTTDAPKQVRISIDGEDQLVEEVWSAAGSAPNYSFPGASNKRFVGRYVANDAANPTFTYYDDDGNVLGPLPLSASQRLAIKQVGISLHVKRTSAFNDEPTIIVNRVRLPNLDYNAVAG